MFSQAHAYTRISSSSSANTSSDITVTGRVVVSRCQEQCGKNVVFKKFAVHTTTNVHRKSQMNEKSVFVLCIVVVLLGRTLCGVVCTVDRFGWEREWETACTCACANVRTATEHFTLLLSLLQRFALLLLLSSVGFLFFFYAPRTFLLLSYSYMDSIKRENGWNTWICVRNKRISCCVYRT